MAVSSLVVTDCAFATGGWLTANTVSVAEPLVAFLREDLARDKVISCAEAGKLGNGRWMRTAGLILVRQMPGSAKGVMFITIEDETGVANLVICRLGAGGALRLASPIAACDVIADALGYFAD